MRSAAIVAVASFVLALGHGTRHGYVARSIVTQRGDAQLVNAWGLAASPTGPWWTSNEARASSTLYSGDGRKQLLDVRVDGGPTGVVYYGGRGFRIRGGGREDSARFIYACEDGMIRAWAATVPTGWSDRAVVAVDDVAQGALFRGLALSGERLYATDFHNAKVVVWDSAWHRLALPFRDPKIPSWYAPFGIQAVGDRIFVTYEFRAPVNGNDAPTGGYVDEFTRDGVLVARLPHGMLNEPWGIARAPEGFGRFGGDLLVANFGDGSVRAFRRAGRGWRYDGALYGQNGKQLALNGVWGIAFGNGGMAGARDSLFWAAGPHAWRGPTEQSVGGTLGRIDYS